jgi:hypothetical protein
MMPYLNSRPLMNNQLASGVTAGKSLAGAGLSRGKAQQSADRYRSGVARAGAEGEASQTKTAADLYNYSYGNQQRSDANNQRLQYDTLSQRAQQGAWDSRFNNLQTAWGALAGLLR